MSPVPRLQVTDYRYQATGNFLPGSLANPRDLARQCHITEHYTAEAKITDIPSWAARKLATIFQANLRRVLRQFIQRFPITGGFKSSTFIGIMRHHAFSFPLSGFY